MRTPVIAGNWKMNMTISEAVDLVKGIHFGLHSPGNAEVVVAPPFTALHDTASFLKDSFIAVCAQNIFWEEKGAFTGEIPGAFIKDAGADYVIIGHSERRGYFGETDETVNRRIKAAFKHDLIPIICIGETLEEREAGSVEDVLKTQIEGGLAGLTSSEIASSIIAYEPVWAIGTGKTATPAEAEDAHLIVRNLIRDNFGTDAANAVRILYGGSMKPDNCKELLALPNVDGGLIGGASLKPADFIGIIKNV